MWGNYYCNCWSSESVIPTYKFMGVLQRGKLEKEFILDISDSPYVYFSMGIQKGEVRIRNRASSDYEWVTMILGRCEVTAQPVVVNRVRLEKGVYVVTTQISNRDPDQPAEGGWTMSPGGPPA